MSYRLRVLGADIKTCSRCERKAAWRDVGNGPDKAVIVVVVPAVTHDMAAIGEVMHPASRDYAWLDFLFSQTGYPLDDVRMTSAVKCAGSIKPSPESLHQCRAHLAKELTAVDAKVLLLLSGLTSYDWWPLWLDEAPVAFGWNDATFVRSDGVEVGVFELPSFGAAEPFISPHQQPEWSPLAKAISAIADAVKVVTGVRPFKRAKAPLLVGEFARRFKGYADPRITLGAVAEKAGYGAREEIPFLKKIELQLSGVGLPKDVHRSVLRFMRSRFLQGADTFRYWKIYEGDKKNEPIYEGKWLIDDGPDRASDNRIARHLTGEEALASFGLHRASVLTLDLDRHGDFQRINFDDTLAKTRALFPRAFPLRSSSSGGAHLLIFLTNEVNYKELAGLARLFLHRHGLGEVPVGDSLYERVEIPANGVRLPLGPGSYPLLKGFDESSPVLEMLGAMVEHAETQAVDPLTLFTAERADVDMHIEKTRWPVTLANRIRAAQALLHEEQQNTRRSITKDAVERLLESDHYGSLFKAAPDFVKRLYAVGIETYGTRWRATKRIPVWLAARGCSKAKAVRILEHWVMNRRHVSHDIQNNIDRIIKDLPKVVKSAFGYARQKGYSPGKITTGDIRWFLHLLSAELPPGTARPPQGSTTLPAREGTANMHFLQLAHEMVAFLRGHGGEHWIAKTRMKDAAWGGRDYFNHLTRLEAFGVVERTGEASIPKHESRTYRVRLDAKPGNRVKDLMSGLAQVMSTKEIERTFFDKPAFIKDLKARRRRWKAKKKQK